MRGLVALVPKDSIEEGCETATLACTIFRCLYRVRDRSQELMSMMFLSALFKTKG